MIKTLSASSKECACGISPTRSVKGDLVTITAIPNAGFQVDQVTAVTVRGVSISVTAGENGVYTFTQSLAA